MTTFAAAQRMTTAEQTEAPGVICLKIHLLPTTSTERWPTSARHSVSSVYSVDYKKNVFIRVNSWFLKKNQDAVFLLCLQGVCP
jgi:hypothetical protein